MMTVSCCSGGEMLYRLNGMLVSRWSNDILLQQFRVIIPAAFQLVGVAHARTHTRMHTWYIIPVPSS